MGIQTYAEAVNRRRTPQSEPIPGSAQAENSAGGYSFAVDDWTRLDRFLILGSDGGSYYAGPRELTRENAACVERLLKSDEDAARLVRRVVEISDSGRAPKNEPAILALGMALKLGGAPTRKLARQAVPKVCRIGTHLFQLAEVVQSLGGWGRNTKGAFSDWYRGKETGALSYQLVKYQQRNGWSHRDLLRLSHPKPKTAEQRYAWGWAADKQPATPWVADRALLGPILAFEELKAMGARKASAREIGNYVRDNRLPWECVPTEYLKHPQIWEALLPDMGLTALIRNLGRMTAIGTLKPLSVSAAVVCDRLTRADELSKARIHPLSILVALRTYEQGHGEKGNLSWTPVQEVRAALEEAFYLSFGAVTPTGKRHLLALDVSGSMAFGSVGGTPLTPREASSALAMVAVRTEKRVHAVAFTAGGWGADRPSMHHGYPSGLSEFPINARTDLRTAFNLAGSMQMGGTDCAAPMLYALERGLEVDCFTVLTDNETWAGNIHPAQALAQYRRKSGIPAKLVVVGMVSNGFSIANPNDSGMLDVVGFDTAAPAIISDFAAS